MLATCRICTCRRMATCRSRWSTLRSRSSKGKPNSLFDNDGSALVIHAKADDYKSDPAGNAGGDIACGVIQPSGAKQRSARSPAASAPAPARK